jgi:hypothetical protein
MIYQTGRTVRCNLVTSNENLYTDQIDKDVNRTFNGFEEYENAQYSKEQLSKFLEMILNGVINQDSSLHYYQGFNDIVAIFLLIGGEDLGFKMSFRCAQSYFKYPILAKYSSLTTYRVHEREFLIRCQANL